MVQRENVDRSEPETARKETTISTDPAKTDKEYKESFIDPFKDAYMSKYTVSTPSAALLAQTVLNNECTSDSSLIRVKIVYLKYYGIDANYSDREAWANTTYLQIRGLRTRNSAFDQGSHHFLQC